MTIRLSPRLAGILLTVLGGGVIGALTLVPDPELAGESARTPLWCLACGVLGGIDLVWNVALFVPFGAGLASLGIPWRRAVLIVVALTCLIEAAQLTILPGRDASLGDVLANTLGGACGVLLVRRWWAMLLSPEPARARLLAVGCAAVWLGLTAAAAALYRPSTPEGPYWGLWGPERRGYAEYRGEVLEAIVNGREVPSWRIGETSALRSELGAGTLAVDVVATAALPNDGIATVFLVANEAGDEILFLGFSPEGIVFRSRRLASHVRLRDPMFLLPVSPNEGDTLRIEVGTETTTVSLALAGGPGWSTTVTPSWAWTFLAPFSVALGRATPVFAVIWVGVWLGAFGYWIGRGTTRLGTTFLIGAALIVLGAWGVPALMAVPPLPPGEWGGAAAGMTVGSLVGRSWRRGRAHRLG